MEPTSTVPPAVPPQTPVTPPVTPPVQPPNKSRKIILIGVIVFVLIILSIIGYLFVYKKNNLPVLTPSPTPTNSSTPIPTVSVVISPTIISEIRVILKKNIETTIPGTSMKVIYVGNTVPGRGCVDCGSSYQIRIIKEGKSTIVSLSCGGITGACIEENVFNYILKVGDNVSDEEIDVLVKNEKN